MLSKKANELKKETSYIVVGAYLVGVAEGVAVIDEKTPLRVLGESFCNYNEKNVIDLTKRDLIDLHDPGTAPNAGGVLSALISQCNSKIDQRLRNISNMGLSSEAAMSALINYVKDVQRAAVGIAVGEGTLDEDLKEDIRVLLKEAKNEFIKREEEESIKEETVEGDADLAPEMGEEELPEEGGEGEEEPAPFSDEDEGVDVFDENTPTEEEPEEEGEKDPVEEEFGVPSGKEEKAGVDTSGKVAVGESTEFEKRKIVAGSMGIKNVDLMNDEEFSEALKQKNRVVSYAENAKYLHNGNVINISPIKLNRMVKELIEVEKASIRTLGESVRLSNVIENDSLALKHKKVVNELAVIIAARNKYNFK